MFKEMYARWHNITLKWIDAHELLPCIFKKTHNLLVEITKSQQAKPLCRKGADANLIKLPSHSYSFAETALLTFQFRKIPFCFQLNNRR